MIPDRPHCVQIGWSSRAIRPVPGLPFTSYHGEPTPSRPEPSSGSTRPRATASSRLTTAGTTSSSTSPPSSALDSARSENASGSASSPGPAATSECPPKTSLSSRLPTSPPPPPSATGTQSGTVKWFNATKGYGFIAPEDSAKDVFVHALAVERAGLGTLREGQRVSFAVQPGRDGRSSAENLSAD